MSKHSDIPVTERLLKVKRRFGHEILEKPEAPDTEAPQAAPLCVFCGYSQEGQSVDRCPECGLLFASQLRDPTPWFHSSIGLWGWWQTACKVWSWDRRIRVRTSIIPTTPGSASFAKLSIIFAAPALGLAAGVLGWRPAPSPAATTGYLTLRALTGGVLAALLMFVLLRSLRWTLQGTWRRELAFVPACIDYSTAFWPFLSVVALVLSWVYAWSGPDTLVPTVSFFIMALAVWIAWLWGSVTESENVGFVAPRVLLLLLLLVPGGTWTVFFISSSSRALMKGLVSAATPARQSITCALVFNTMQSDPNEALVQGQLARLGARPQDTIVIRGSECTLANLGNALSKLQMKLFPQDRFIVYINFRGTDQDNPTNMELPDGTLTGFKLASDLASIPTDRVLIAIESGSGPAVVPLLATMCDAVVVTAPDVPEFKYTEGLKDFWETLDEPESDRNKDGRITVKEAFEAAYRPMLDSLARIRDRQRRRSITEEVGKSAPAFEVIGKAPKDDFWTKTPPKAAAGEEFEGIPRSMPAE